jgi:16S rRNA G966 N2-methylase RsmD
MLYGAKVAVCSEINTKHTNTVWQNIKLLNAKPVGSSCNQEALKG